LELKKNPEDTLFFTYSNMLDFLDEEGLSYVNKKFEKIFNSIVSYLNSANYKLIIEDKVPETFSYYPCGLFEFNSRRLRIFIMIEDKEGPQYIGFITDLSRFDSDN
jgi:hypothetical protein